MNSINKLVIHLDILKQNFRAIKDIVGPKKIILGVVKSDAYWHGIIPIAKTLESAGIDSLAIFDIEEAVILRDAGIKIPILIMMGITNKDIPRAIQYNLTPAIFELDIAEKLSKYALMRNVISKVHIKVDTGMTRLGVAVEDFSNFLKQLLFLKGIHIDGIFSHLSVSEEKDNPFTDYQIKLFKEIIKEAKNAGITGTSFHIANSGAILEKKGLMFGMVRPGLLLYGSMPNQIYGSSTLIKPIMAFKSEIISIKDVPSGRSVSYGGTFVTKKDSKIALIPVGYDDGFSRLLSNKGEVLVKGERVPVIGNICMNLTMLDITDVQGVHIGDEVILLGSQGGEYITAEEIGKKIGIINYEVLCSIGKSNRRIYV